MTSHREFAARHAEAFTERTLEQIRGVLTAHSAAVVEYAVEMQARLDAAEDLLKEIAGATIIRTSDAGNFKTLKIRTELVERVAALVAQSKARSQ